MLKSQAQGPSPLWRKPPQNTQEINILADQYMIPLKDEGGLADAMRKLAAKEVAAARDAGLYQVTWKTMDAAERWRAEFGLNPNRSRREKVFDLAAQSDKGICVNDVQKRLGYTREMSKRLILALRAEGRIEPVHYEGWQQMTRYVVSGGES